MLSSSVGRRASEAYRAILAIGALALGVSIASHALLGWFMRYSGDDYCYAAEITQRGFWEAQWNAYFGQANYSGNRYSLTLVAGVSDLLGPGASSILPGAALVLWVTAIAFGLARAARPVSIRLSRLEVLLLAECLVFFTLEQAPDLPQVVYWRSAMLPYLAPLVAICFLVAAVIGMADGSSRRWWRLAGVGALAFFAGGFSETATALFLVAFSLALVLLLGFRRKGSRAWLAPVAASWLGTLAAMLALAFSPSTRLRMLQMQASAPPDPMMLLKLSVQYAYLFVRSTVRWHFLPNLVVAALFFLFALDHASRHPSAKTVPLRRLILGLLCIPPLAFLLVMAVTAPSAYTQWSFPVARAMVAASFVVVLAAGAAGTLVGWLAFRGRAARWLSPSRHRMLLGVAVIGCCVFSIGALTQVVTDLPRFTRWAAFWDARDAEIRTARNAGVMQLEVMQIDHIIPDVAELSPDAGFWYNVCAARYYDVRSIAANQPGWDELP